MRTPENASASETPQDRPRRRRYVMALLVAAVVVGGLVIYVAVVPGSPLRILGVSVSPDPPLPGQPLTVTAHIQGGSLLLPPSAVMSWLSFFKDTSAGGGGLFARGGDAYAGTLGPFPNGTAVWIVVIVSDGHTVQVSENNTAEVGTVRTGLASGLRLNSEAVSPAQPTSFDSPVVTANLTSAANLTSVQLGAIDLLPGGTGNGGQSGDMQKNASGNYTTSPLYGFAGGPGGSGTEAGTVWMYRIAAMDATGNTVLTPVYRFTVALPAG